MVKSFLCGHGSVGRASAFQAECRGFKSRLFFERGYKRDYGMECHAEVGWNMMEIIFGILGTISYVYLGIRIIPMRVKFASFVYLLFLAIFLIGLVIGNQFFTIIWTVITILLTILVFVLVR